MDINKYVSSLLFRKELLAPIMDVLAKNGYSVTGVSVEKDILFRLSSSTDPEVVEFLNDQPDIMILLRYIKKTNFPEKDIQALLQAAMNIKTDTHSSITAET